MAERPGQAGAGKANPAGAVAPLIAFWNGFIAGGVGVFLSVAGILLVLALLIALGYTIARSPKAARWWIGTGGVAVGFAVVRVAVLVVFRI